MAKKYPGLTKIKNIWHIDKRLRGYGRLCETTGYSEREDAEKHLIHRVKEIQDAAIYGVRPIRTFNEAALKYL